VIKVKPIIAGARGEKTKIYGLISNAPEPNDTNIMPPQYILFIRITWSL
jgi:hypothetical protein